MKGFELFTYQKIVGLRHLFLPVKVFGFQCSMGPLLIIEYYVRINSLFEFLFG